jgi:hypothetical protein
MINTEKFWDLLVTSTGSKKDPWFFIGDITRAVEQRSLPYEHRELANWFIKILRDKGHLQEAVLSYRLNKGLIIKTWDQILESNQKRKTAADLDDRLQESRTT